MAIWLNGKLQETGEISAQSAGLTLGWGVFSTLQIHHGHPRFFARHFARLKRDAHEAEVPLEWSETEVFSALREVLAQNQIQTGAARLTLSKRGEGRWNTQSGADFSILAVASAPPKMDGLRAEISPFRVSAQMPLAGLKTTSYLPYLWIWQQAQSRGFDEAILLTTEGWICEAARSNLIWCEDNQLWTPSPETGCLRGIGRDLVLEWARENHIKIKEGEFELADLQKAQEIWLVSAGTGIRRLETIENSGAIAWKADESNGLLQKLRRWWDEKSENFPLPYFSP